MIMVYDSVKDRVFVRDGEPFVELVSFESSQRGEPEAWRVAIPCVDFGFILAELVLGMRGGLCLTYDLRAKYHPERVEGGSLAFNRLVKEVLVEANGWVESGDFCTAKGIDVVSGG